MGSDAKFILGDTDDRIFKMILYDESGGIPRGEKPLRIESYRKTMRDYITGGLRCRKIII